MLASPGRNAFIFSARADSSNRVGYKPGNYVDLHINLEHSGFELYFNRRIKLRMLRPARYFDPKPRPSHLVGADAFHAAYAKLIVRIRSRIDLENRNDSRANR
jgi:hypothetical protein